MATVVRVGTDSSGRPIYARQCFDCRQPSEKSRCPRCAKLHRKRAAYRKQQQGYKNPRSAFGHAMGRGLRSGDSILSVLAKWIDTDPTLCWEWPGCINNNGYGQYLPKVGPRGLAHRLMFSEVHHAIEPGTVVHHKCANRACVNPLHLQAVTPVENTAEMLERRALKRRIAELEARVAELEGQDA